MPTGGVKGQAHHAAESREVGWLGRLGLASKGVIYGIVALLAIRVAVEGSGRPEDPKGALGTISEEPFGAVLLGALGIGFAAYALWSFAEGLLGRGDDDEGITRIVKRAGSIALGCLYAGLSVLAFAVLGGMGEGSGGPREEKRATAEVLGWPYGTWLVGAVGAAFIAAGALNAYRTVSHNFRDDLKTREMTGPEDRWYTRIGVLGHAARATVFALIGAFLVKAAVEYDPKEAVGLDGALQKLAQQSHGPIVLGVVAAGLLAYGAFCLVQARYSEV